jgi:uncharacterized coiled-coil DUF342 family protein
VPEGKDELEREHRSRRRVILRRIAQLKNEIKELEEALDRIEKAYQEERRKRGDCGA